MVIEHGYLVDGTCPTPRSSRWQMQRAGQESPPRHCCWLNPGRGGGHPPARVSDHEGQLGERVGEAGSWGHVGPEVVEA
jgi:hypothetical protein